MYFLSISFNLTFVFFFNDTATTEIYTLSLHDALPIYFVVQIKGLLHEFGNVFGRIASFHHDLDRRWRDRKSTRLNSSHPSISYAVFCLKKKKKYRLSSPSPNLSKCR